MARKPPKQTKAPSHLAARSQKLWDEIVSSGRWTGPRLAVLQAGLEALDRSDQAREAIADHGLVTKTEKTNVLHVNPLARLEKDARSQFFAAMEKLRLHY